MAMRDQYEIAVGDTVWIRHGNRSRTEGIVEKIGPKLVHIREGKYRLSAFYRDGQLRRDGGPGSFSTQAQCDDADARVNAESVLRQHGVEIRHRSEWSTPLLTVLAEYVDRIHSIPEVKA